MADAAEIDTVTMARQRPAYAVVPPSLTRHLLFRIPHHEQPHYPEGQTAQLKKWTAVLKPINGYLQFLHSAFETPGRHRRFRITEEDGRRKASGDTDLVLASETLLCELQPANKAEGRPRVRIRVDVHSEHVTLTHIIDHIDKGSTLGQTIAALSADRVEYFYDTYWLADFLPDQPAGELAKRLNNLGGPYSRPYAEFRGVILGLQPPEAFHGAGAEPFGSDEEAPPGRVGDRLTGGIARFTQDHATFLRTLVRSENPTEAALGAAVTEAVVCGMLGGRALYASPLADRPGVVRYLAAYDGCSASQLGRFIRRLHTLGELRLNALLDLSEDDQRDRERSLRRIGQKIRRLSEKVDEALVEDRADGVTADHIADLSKEHTEASRTIDAGVIHRVERSHNYVAALERRISDLRIVHIEGWQSYDAFVRRYHSQDHDYIAGVGRRYHALGQRIDRLMFLHQSRVSEAYQKSLKNAVTNIENLQERAEDIAVLAVIYYGASSISYLDGLSEAIPFFGVFKEHKHLIQGIGALATVVAIVDTLLLERRLRVLLLTVFGFVGGLLGLLLLPFDYLIRALWRRVRPIGGSISAWRDRLLQRALPPAVDDPLMYHALRTRAAQPTSRSRPSQ